MIENFVSFEVYIFFLSESFCSFNYLELQKNIDNIPCEPKNRKCFPCVIFSITSSQPNTIIGISFLENDSH